MLYYRKQIFLSYDTKKRKEKHGLASANIPMSCYQKEIPIISSKTDILCCLTKNNL